MCLICPNHECAHFRPFWAIFHIFSPPCTMFSTLVHARLMDQCTIYDMSVMDIGPMVHTPRGRSGATFVRVLAESEGGQFCHFGICGPNWDCHHAEWHGDLGGPRARESPSDSWWIAYGMADQISKPAWRYTIGSTPEFWLISGSQNDPLLGPQFHPPVWSIGGPISLCP